MPVSFWYHHLTIRGNLRAGRYNLRSETSLGSRDSRGKYILRRLRILRCEDKNEFEFNITLDMLYFPFASTQIKLNV